MYIESNEIAYFMNIIYNKFLKFFERTGEKIELRIDASGVLDSGIEHFFFKGSEFSMIYKDNEGSFDGDKYVIEVALGVIFRNYLMAVAGRGLDTTKYTMYYLMREIYHELGHYIHESIGRFVDKRYRLRRCMEKVFDKKKEEKDKIFVNMVCTSDDIVDKMIINTIEDVWIEQRMKGDFKGVKDIFGMVNLLLMDVYEDMIKFSNGSSRKKMFMDLREINMVLLTYHNFGEEWVRNTWEEIDEEFLKDTKNLLESIYKAESPEDSYEDYLLYVKKWLERRLIESVEKRKGDKGKGEGEEDWDEDVEDEEEKKKRRKRVEQRIRKEIREFEKRVEDTKIVKEIKIAMEEAKKEEEDLRKFLEEKIKNNELDREKIAGARVIHITAGKREEYKEIAERHKQLRVLMRKYKEYLKKQKKDYDYKYNGSKVSIDRVMNGKEKVFKGKDRTEPGGIEVCVLIDQSGSMLIFGHMGMARELAVGVNEILQEAGIDYEIYGFSEVNTRMGWTFLFMKYKDIYEKRYNGYNLTKIKAISENYDAFYVEYLARRMLKRAPNKAKLMIILSDGKPATPLCKDRESYERLVNVVEKMRRKGVEFIAFSLDSDVYSSHRAIFGSRNVYPVYNGVKEWEKAIKRIVDEVRRHM